MSEAITEPNFHGPVPYTKITSERYISTEYMLKERDNIWSKTWLVAGPAQDVEEPGDFFVFELEICWSAFVGSIFQCFGDENV